MRRKIRSRTQLKNGQWAHFLLLNGRRIPMVMDREVIRFLTVIAEAREEFLSDDSIRLIDYTARGSLISRYLTNETYLIELCNRIVTSNFYNNLANTLLTVTIPTDASFSEPVVVAPTAQQVNAAIEPISSASSPCAICQEPVSSGGIRLRSCRHEYHRSCIRQWFSMSVRCPVCRHDIRETGPQEQTSPASTQTSVQPEALSQEPHTSE